MNFQHSISDQLKDAEAAGDVDALVALVRHLLAERVTPKKTGTAPKPRTRRITKNTPHHWAVVEFADGITILQSYFGAVGEFDSVIETAQRKRAQALAGTPYGTAYQRHLKAVPRIVKCFNVMGARTLHRARIKAYWQRERGPRPWGKCLTDPTLSPHHRGWLAAIAETKEGAT